MKRARQRYTAMVRVDERLSVGVEANPEGDDYGLLVNYRVFDETERRPALIVGTSSDRIGTPDGRAYYATFSKDVESWTGLPIAPYFGTAYGEFEDEFEWIGGVRVRWSETWNSTHMWDGENLHHLLGRSFGERYQAQAILVEQDGDYYVGFSLGASF